MTKRFYVLHLNRDAKGMVDRFSVMQIGADGAMVPLWGTPEEGKACTDDPKKAASAWPYMVYKSRPTTGRDRFPAFHFALHGYGYSKVLDLAQALADKLGEDVELFPVTGWNASPTKASPRPRA